ncbi:MAG: hypothetical protein JXA25_20650 [Anaerolineales bacterium]|nr:hypothetical protein [Anaerolineales bacterium]
MREKEIHSRRWYRLDNAAKLYPAIRSRKNPSTFRVSATMKDPVDPVILQQALDDTLIRLPGFSVRMRSGLFWHYFLQAGEPFRIQEDVVNPCMDFHTQDNGGYLIRVRYFDRRIALEVFHSITDGSGAMVFLKTMVGRYLQLRGIPITPGKGMLDCESSPEEEELADSFREFAGNSSPRSRREQQAYHVPGLALPGAVLNLITGTIPTDALRAEAIKHSVTVTEYLVSVLLFTLYQIQQKDKPRCKQPVKVSVPVNLRQFFPTQTLRNFSSYINPGVEPTQGEYHFDEVIRLVHHFIRYEATEKQLRGKVAANVSSEKSIFVRLAPLFLKNFIISMVYKGVGPTRFTSTLSNLGRVEIPEQMLDHIEHFDLILGPSRVTRVNCAVVGYNGSLRINFSRVIRETFVERAFFTFLVRQGIPVKIESNME